MGESNVLFMKKVPVQLQKHQLFKSTVLSSSRSTVFREKSTLFDAFSRYAYILLICSVSLFASYSPADVFRPNRSELFS